MKTNNLKIEIEFTGGLNRNQKNVFEQASNLWMSVLTDKNIEPLEGIEGVLISASGTRIDGPGRILGQAGPTHVRKSTHIPVKGIMEFDTSDLARMEADGSLIYVIIHEMAHVLGFGTLWQTKNLVSGIGTHNPVFIGENAQREFGSLISNGPQPVPVANTGGRGTRDSHWREDVFGNELMTGFLGNGKNPLSRLTIASFEDLGYQVTYESAEKYGLPQMLELAIMGVWARDAMIPTCTMCGTRDRFTEFIYV